MLEPNRDGKFYLLNYSGGKDSTALLLILLNEPRKYPLTDIVFCDTGAEFDEVYCTVEKVKAIIPRHVRFHTVRSKYPLPFMLSHYRIKKGDNIGKPYRWPTPRYRWCTREHKTVPLHRFVRSSFSNNRVVSYTGFASQERARAVRKQIRASEETRFPLIEKNISSQEALKLCYRHGFSWSGLYEEFSRLSCWLCPFKQIRELHSLMKLFPEYWQFIKDVEQIHRAVWKKWWKFSVRYGSTDEIERRQKCGRAATSRPTVRTQVLSSTAHTGIIR